MEWHKIWRTVFCGWDGDVDLTALAEELRSDGSLQSAGHRSFTVPFGSGEGDRASTWVCQQIQSAY